MSPYGLGIDMGAGTVTAALCLAEDGPRPAEAWPLPGGVPADAMPVDLPVRQALARVGDPTPLYGGPEPRTGASVLAALAGSVRRAVAAVQGEPPSWTVVAVPPSWGEHRRAELSAALAAELGERCTLASSAVAAVRHHRGDASGTVAVYDVGAGSVDCAVVRVTPGGTLEHAAVPPPPHPWGGRDIDDAVLHHVRTAAGLPDTVRTPRDRVRLTALRSSCVAAKERLSTELSVRVDVDVSGSRGSVRLVRADLDELIARSVVESVAAARVAVTEAGLTAADLDGLVLAGGSALVPLVASTLSAELEIPLLVDDRPGETVACGAAELAADVLIALALAADVEDEYRDDEESDDGSGAVVGLDRYRFMNTAQRMSVRAVTVAALLAVLIATPLSLMGLLGGGVSPRSAQGVAVAEEPSAPDPAADPTPTAEGAADAGTGGRGATDAVVGPTKAAPTTAPKAAAAARTATAPLPVPAPVAPATQVTDPTAPPTGPTTDPTTDPTTEPPADPTTDPPSDPTTEPPADPTTDPPSDPTTEPPTDPSTAPDTETPPEGQSAPTDTGGGAA